MVSAVTTTFTIRVLLPYPSGKTLICTWHTCMYVLVYMLWPWVTEFVPTAILAVWIEFFRDTLQLHVRMPGIELITCYRPAVCFVSFRAYTSNCTCLMVFILYIRICLWCPSLSLSLPSLLLAHHSTAASPTYLFRMCLWITTTSDCPGWHSLLEREYPESITASPSHLIAM